MTYRTFVAAAVMTVAVACSPQVSVHGFAPTPEELQSIEPGVDTMFSIEERIGRPTVAGLLRNDAWYYVQSTMEQLTYNPAKEVNRRVVVIGFAEDGVVKDVNEYGLEDGRIIDLNTRVTVAKTGQKGILSQIFGNLFNLDAASILGDN